METVEVTFLGKKYFFQSDQPEALEDTCLKLNWELDRLQEDYSGYSREELLLLYILRNQPEVEIQEPEIETESQEKEMFSASEQPKEEEEEIADEQLGVDLDEIDNILNTEL